MEERQSARDGIREGLRAGMDILAAFKEAVEEALGEMKERGDISPDRAREAIRTTMQRAQEAMDLARERLDFVPRREFEALREEVAALQHELRAHTGAPPEGAEVRKQDGTGTGGERAPETANGGGTAESGGAAAESMPPHLTVEEDEAG